MIIRKQHDHLLLITQPDHAALASAIMAAWQADGFPSLPRRDAVLLATLHHDDGWRDVDVEPLVSADGRLLDFISAPAEVRLAVWPRAVEPLAAVPYAAALVAQHALQLYEPNRGNPAMAGFFSRMEALRDRHLAGRQGLTRNDLTRDYFFLQMGDTLSLAFCNGWTEARRQAHYEMRPQGTRLTIDPDPFGGREISLSVTARRLPDHSFTRDEARAAFDAAPLVTLTAVASGGSRAVCATTPDGECPRP